MRFQVASKLEVNLLNPKTNPGFLSNFLVKNRVPTVVTDPAYIAQLITHRAANGGKYKIICALDFPRGNQFALDKIYRAHPDLAAADGYEILLTGGRSGVESRNEMKSLREFLKMNNSFADIRWCLGALTRTKEDVESMLKNMKDFPPSFVRIDNHLITPRATLDEHKRLVDLVREYVPFPIKVSGNVDLEVMNTLESVRKFDVSLEQAEALVKEADKAADKAASEALAKKAEKAASEV